MQKLTRRHVIATITTSSVLLCPAILNAQVTLDLDWDGIPTDTPVGQDRLITLPAGPAQVDVSDLQPGEVAVIARPSEDEKYSSTGMTQYVAVHRRTDAQIAAADGAAYFVADLVCTHRGKAIGLTGNLDSPFACTDRRGRHGSVYDSTGRGVAGASEGERMSTPEHTLSIGDQVVLSLA